MALSPGFWRRWRAWWLLGLCHIGLHDWRDRRLHMRRNPIDYCVRCMRVRKPLPRPTTVYAPYLHPEPAAPLPPRPRVTRDPWVYDPRAGASGDVQPYAMGWTPTKCDTARGLATRLRERVSAAVAASAAPVDIL